MEQTEKPALDRMPPPRQGIITTVSLAMKCIVSCVLHWYAGAVKDTKYDSVEDRVAGASLPDRVHARSSLTWMLEQNHV